MDITKKPYAKWLEESVKAVVGLEPETICIVARSSEKSVVFTGYYNADAEDKAVMAHHIYTDAIMDVIRNSKDEIRDMWEEDDEEDYYEPDAADLEMGFDPYSGSYTGDC